MTSAQWNKKHKEGTPVRYYPILGVKSEFMDGVTRSQAWDVCCTPVVLVTGRAGGLALINLEVLPVKE